MGWRRLGTDSVVVFRVVMVMAEAVVLEVMLTVMVAVMVLLLEVEALILEVVLVE